MELEINGRLRQVTVRPHEGAWMASVDGAVRVVDAARAASRLSLLIDGQSYDVVVQQPGRGELDVYVEGHQVSVHVPGRAARFGDRRERAHTGDGSVEVAAPMPGRIVKVLVAAGERVMARQPVVVIEAMKMENELRAPRAGTVTAVNVREGAAVEARTRLVVIE